MKVNENIAVTEQIEIHGDLGEQIEKTSDMVKQTSSIVEERKKMFENILNDEDVPEQMKEDARKHLENTREMEEAMNEMAEQFKEIMEKQNKLLAEMQNEYKREDIIEYAKAIRDRAAEEGNIKEVAKSDSFIAEMEYGVSLGLLFDGLHKIKNVSNIIAISKDEKQFTKLYKKYIERLKNDREYLFRDPSTLEANLTKIYGNKEDARIFLASYLKFFGRQEVVNEYSVFINEFSRNVENFDNEKFLERDMLIHNLKDYIATLKDMAEH